MCHSAHAWFVVHDSTSCCPGRQFCIQCESLEIWPQIAAHGDGADCWRTGDKGIGGDRRIRSDRAVRGWIASLAATEGSMFYDGSSFSDGLNNTSITFDALNYLCIPIISLSPSPEFDMEFESFSVEVTRKKTGEPERTPLFQFDNSPIRSNYFFSTLKSAFLKASSLKTFSACSSPFSFSTSPLQLLQQN